MTNLRTNGTEMRRSRWARNLVAIVMGAVLAVLPLFFVTMLLALSIHEYQSYTAATSEYGGTAALNAKEERGNIIMGSLALVVLWFFLTGLAAAYAAVIEGRVLRTAIWAGGVMAVAIGAMLLFGLTVGTA
ncbi:hypothetical protein GE115_12490 [Agromyces sp. CFH 90414]|uniref:Uncharacterized protein n=1 Tax=Agromyces agglutinans TaxID=2662258 RepID=A0A6I2FDD5_9MICO|nr:hypothetical protein [Agromyces agglutinans]MRG60680.1 hypothetical protein [Agromyces agglutinans]